MHFLEHEEFVIISACTKNQHWRDAVVKTKELQGELNKLGYAHKLIYGKYEGQAETSAYVPWLTDSHAKQLCERFSQKTYLSVNRHREARLVHVDGQVAHCGYFTKGESEDNFTIDGGIKYICTGIK